MSLPGLDGIPAPTLPKEGTPWIGTWEQLAGALHALSEAWKRDYPTCSQRTEIHARVRVPTSEALTHEGEVPQAWAARFFFHAGLQRTVWAHERLLRVLASTDCPQCGEGGSFCASGHLKWDVIRKHADRAIRHQKSHERMLPEVEVLLNHPEAEGLREVVNSRKHRLYPYSEHTLGMQTWNDLPNDEKFSRAVTLLRSAVEAHNVLVAWNPVPSIRATCSEHSAGKGWGTCSVDAP